MNRTCKATRHPVAIDRTAKAETGYRRMTMLSVPTSVRRVALLTTAASGCLKAQDGISLHIRQVIGDIATLRSRDIEPMHGWDACDRAACAQGGRAAFGFAIATSRVRAGSPQQHLGPFPQEALEWQAARRSAW